MGGGGVKKIELKNRKTRANDTNNSMRLCKMIQNFPKGRFKYKNRREMQRTNASQNNRLLETSGSFLYFVQTFYIFGLKGPITIQIQVKTYIFTDHSFQARCIAFQHVNAENNYCKG